MSDKSKICVTHPSPSPSRSSGSPRRPGAEDPRLRQRARHGRAADKLQLVRFPLGTPPATQAALVALNYAAVGVTAPRAEAEGNGCRGLAGPGHIAGGTPEPTIVEHDDQHYDRQSHCHGQLQKESALPLQAPQSRTSHETSIILRASGRARSIPVVPLHPSRRALHRCPSC